MAFFSGSFGGLSGLAKEVSLDDFHKGLQMGELREAKKVAAKAKQDEYKQRMLEQIKPLDTDLLPILRSEYDTEQNRIFGKLAEDTRTGKLFEDGRLVGDYQRNLLSNKNKYEGVSKALDSFTKTDPKYLTPAALDWKQQLERVDKPYTDVKKEFAAKYSGEDFITPEGDVDLSKLIVTDQNPIGTLAKTLQDQKYILSSSQKQPKNGVIETHNQVGVIKTNNQKKDLIAQGLATPDAVSYEDVLDQNLQNEEFVTNVKRNHSKEYKKYNNEIIENIAKGAALAAGQKEGTTLYKDTYERIKKDPQTLLQAEKEAVKRIGMDLAVLPSEVRVSSHAPINITNNLPSNQTKKEEAQKYSGIFGKFADNKPQIIQSVLSSNTPQDAFNAYISLSGTKPTIKIDNVPDNTKLYQPITLSDNVKSTPTTQTIDGNTKIDITEKGRRVQRKLSEILSPDELNYLLSKTNSISVYPKEQSLYAYNYDNGTFLTAGEFKKDKNSLNNTAPLIRRYNVVNTQYLNPIFTETGIDKKQRINKIGSGILKKLSDAYLIQDKEITSDVSDWDKLEPEYIKSYQQDKNIPLSVQQNAVSNPSSTTPSTTSKPEVKTSKGGVTFKVIK